MHRLFKTLVRSEKLRAKLRLTRSGAPFVVALLAGAVLGPLAGIAIGAAGTTTTETETVPANCTTNPVTTGTATTLTTTTVETQTNYQTTVTTGTNPTPPPTTTTATVTTGTTYTPVTVPVTETVTTPSVTSTAPTCTTTVVRVPVPPYVPPTNTAPAPPAIATPKANPFTGHAMWIWELPAQDGGNVAKIIAQAKADGIGTLIVKSGDGTTPWSQFSKSLVTEIHAAHLKVCAWQYVYGIHPIDEADVGADARKDGADCLVIDAEVQYDGKYSQAATYIRYLRKQIGAKFPVALAGLPYVQYHESFPYSVFLGPDGAQYNLPQMYWIDIGTSVPYVFQTTYFENSIYKRPIYPLGQLYEDSYGAPSAASVGQFLTIARDYHARGDSWWDFQSATAAWIADTAHAAAAPAKFAPITDAVTLVKGNTGDQVIWAQEHLDSAGAALAVDGDYGASTEAAVALFQASHRLKVTGQLNGLTWDALLRYSATTVAWSTKGKYLYSTISKDGKKISSVVTL